MRELPLVVPQQGPPHEIFARDWLVFFGCRDDSGRPLAEGRLAEECRAGVPLVLKPCPFEGSRFQHARPMNYSALKHLGPQWKELRRISAYARREHVRRYPRGRFDLGDVLWFVSALVNLQNYLLRRVKDPMRDGEFPSVIGTLYKTATGVTAASFIMYVSVWLDGADERAPADPQAIHQFAETHRLLIGAREVCAGPPELIDESLRLMVLGDEPDDPTPPSIWWLIDDWEAYLAYATAMMKTEVLKQAFAIQHFAMMHELVGELQGSADREAASLAGRVQEWIDGDGERSWYSAQSSGGVINRYIASRSAGDRARVLAGMARLVDRLERAGTRGIPPAVFTASVTAPPDPLQQRAVREIRRALPRAGAATVDLVACSLARQAVMESLTVEAFTALGAEFAGALGKASSRFYGEADVARAVGITLRQHLCRALTLDVPLPPAMVT
ncbi:MAG: hypothetical protein ACRD26_15345 [Vicinamibacterales bacterium]